MTTPVPTYDPHTFVTFGGKLREVAAADEIWECGIRGGDYVTAFAPVDPAQFDAMLDEIITPALGPSITDWFTAPGSYVPGNVSLDWIKVVNIAADGTYASDPTTRSLSATGGAVITAQCSFLTVALSFTTDHVGRRNKNGRVYPPNFAAPLAVAGSAEISSTAQTDLVASAQQLIAALSPHGSEYQFTPSVISARGGHGAITGVRVGNIMDVQRRRKNAAAETYATAGLS